jgi:16S rRNA G966 N2-methylase RsmD
MAGVVNYLYYGDNLDVLRRYVKDETVDLVYLDPPGAPSFAEQRAGGPAH